MHNILQIKNVIIAIMHIGIGEICNACDVFNSMSDTVIEKKIRITDLIVILELM